MTPGVCVYCDCTEDQPCPDGCGWADESRTTCTRCAFAEQVARSFTDALEAAHRVRRMDWRLRSEADRRVLVTVAGTLVDVFRESALNSMTADHAAAMEQIGRLLAFLDAHHPEAIARGEAQGLTIADVAIGLLPHRNNLGALVQP